MRVAARSLDVGGPDIVSYGELIDRIRHHMLVGRPTIGLPRLTLTPIASRVSSMIAGEEHALIGPLMESLGEDLLPRDDRAARVARRATALARRGDRAGAARVGGARAARGAVAVERGSVCRRMSTVHAQIEIEAPIERVWET